MNRVEQRCQLRGGYVRPGQIEFVVGAVKCAVADQEEREGIIVVNRGGNLLQRLLEVFACGSWRRLSTVVWVSGPLACSALSRSAAHF